MMEIRSRDFKERAVFSIHDANLQQALDRARDGFIGTRAARAAERERLGLAPPPAGASLLLAGILALVFAAAALHMLLEPDAEDRRLMLQAASMFLAGGTAAVIVGVRRIRMRRQWRLQSQATARPGD